MIPAFDLKLISLVVVFGGSMVFGLLPSFLGLGTRFRGSVLLSCFLCFGGGVLFATALVHILPEVRENIPSGAELIFCCGFMLIYLFEITSKEIKNWRDNRYVLVQRRTSYGSLRQSTSMNEIPDDDFRVEVSCSNSSLLFALSVHSFLEGLVIGVEPTPRGVLILLLAVCCHKLLMAFCIGCESSAEGRPTFEIIPSIFIFSFGSVAGIGVGSFVQPSHFEHMLIPVLQGLAGGTLLYIFVCEVLPRERKKQLHNFASFAQFISISLGFGLIATVSQLS